MQKQNNMIPVKSQEGNSVPSEPAGVFEPEKIIEQARRAAIALKSVIDQKPKKVMVNNEQYLEFEDWQTLARFYGYTVETGEAEEIWREGKLVGFKAKSTIYHLRGDRVDKVGGAEASCMRDEPHWNVRPKYEWKTIGGERQRIQVGVEPVPEFQLGSMAQTRAASKGLRNVLAWVAVLAGYRPTPAEEIIGEENGNGKCKYCGAVGKYHKPKCPGVAPIKPVQSAEEEINIEKIAEEIPA